MTGEALGRKHRTTAIQKSIETGDRYPLCWFDSRRYVQHNLLLGDGLGPLLEFLDSLPAGSSRVTPIRAFEDGEVSFAHLEYVLPPMGHVVGFEVHRWENGLIVEHWDNLQPIAAAPNAAGLTMTDGPVQATDLERTRDNKGVVEAFVREVLVQGRAAALGTYVALDRYVEHHPDHGGAIGALLGAGHAVVPRYERLHHLFGEGNFCLAISEGRLDGAHTAFYDLFRLEDGLVVEHWDVVETIPPRERWANDNGKF